VREFVVRVLDRSHPNPFLEDFQALRATVAHFGAFNALSQTLLKLTVPGVPDLYQGNETWDFSLVDPDNRRPVDYRERARMLQGLRRTGPHPGFARALVDALPDGRIKLYLIHRVLVVRGDDSELFGRGSYLPLRASGPKRQHVCAFARALDGRQVLVVAPVLVAGLTGAALVPPLGGAVWQDTWLQLPPEGGRYRDAFTGREIVPTVGDSRPGLHLGEVLRDFPVALLERA
jgi:(1->4)-alpha-D-glucan 1-alpha-D-glucosylmutase